MVNLIGSGRVAWGRVGPREVLSPEVGYCHGRVGSDRECLVGQGLLLQKKLGSGRVGSGRVWVMVR